METSAPTYSTRSKRKSSSHDDQQMPPPPPPKKVRTDSPESDEAVEELIPDPPDQPETSARGGLRGRGRGRGRGRAGRGGRGGRPTTVPTSEPLPSKTFRGRGGRVKKSTNSRIQALYHRKANLRTQYKAVSQIHRAGLEALAEKSLDELLEDPHYHESLPEFVEVAKALAAKAAEKSALLNRQYEMQKAFLAKQLAQNQEYEQIQFNVSPKIFSYLE